MNILPHLNYRYPTAINSTLLHHPQQSQTRAQHPRDQHQPMQNYSHSSGTSSHDHQAEPSTATQPWSTTGFPAHHGHQQAMHSGPRGPAQSGSPHGRTNVYSMNELSDKYIPSSSDKITCADHRPLDEIFGHPYTSLGHPPHSGSRSTSASQTQTHSRSQSHMIPSPSSLGRQRQASHQHGHARHQSRPLGPAVLTYPLPTKPQLDGVIQIPLLAVDNQQSGTDLVVSFRCSDWGIGVQMEGIPMTDLLYHNARGLERPQERVLEGFGLTSLRLNILWPNYLPFAKTICASGKDDKPVTRAGLGYEVAQAFAEFFRAIQPTQPGRYTIALLRPGSSAGLRFEQLHLITVRNTSRGEWMAEVRAVLAG
ncbi:hypothetical protein BU15DRAFT_68734 [Melanogaster broomeanus]|nr:hypothetical protein BU15DRAFT_68734 [Melanogaster broomeanus]